VQRDVRGAYIRISRATREPTYMIRLCALSPQFQRTLVRRQQRLASE